MHSLKGLSNKCDGKICSSSSNGAPNRLLFAGVLSAELNLHGSSWMPAGLMVHNLNMCCLMWCSQIGMGFPVSPSQRKAIPKLYHFDNSLGLARVYKADKNKVEIYMRLQGVVFCEVHLGYVLF